MLNVVVLLLISCCQVACVEHHHQSHPVINPSLYLNRTFLDGVDSVALRKISFLNQPYYVAQKVGTYDDSVDFVLKGFSGEPKVAMAFKDKLSEKGEHACQGVLPRPIVLDIGANGGIYGMYSAMMGCNVYFFDIQPACVQGIYLSTIMNGVSSHAHVIHHPVGNASAPIELDVSTSCYGAYRTSTGNQHEEYKNKETNKGAKMTMNMIRVDDIFRIALDAKTLPQIVMIKIDVEGFEVMVLHGMKHLLRSGKIDQITIEFSPYFWPAYSFTRPYVADSVCELLWDAGFQNVTILGNHGARGDSPDIVITDRQHLWNMLNKGIPHQQDALFIRSK